MKKSAFVAMLLSAMFAAGCGTMSGNQSGGEKKSAGQVLDDAVITSKVKTALLADPDVSGLKINVDTEKGRVKLKGEVKTIAIRRKAESITRGVEGVQSVDNQLIITG